MVVLTYFLHKIFFFKFIPDKSPSVTNSSGLVTGGANPIPVSLSFEVQNNNLAKVLLINGVDTITDTLLTKILFPIL